MQIKDSRREMPWAYPKAPGFKGEAPGLFFWYFATKEEAEKALAWSKRKKRYHGPIEYRPGECWQLGYIAL